MKASHQSQEPVVYHLTRFLRNLVNPANPSRTAFGIVPSDNTNRTVSLVIQGGRARLLAIWPIVRAKERDCLAWWLLTTHGIETTVSRTPHALPERAQVVIKVSAFSAPIRSSSRRSGCNLGGCHISHGRDRRRRRRCESNLRERPEIIRRSQVRPRWPLLIIVIAERGSWAAAAAAATWSRRRTEENKAFITGRLFNCFGEGWRGFVRRRRVGKQQPWKQYWSSGHSGWDFAVIAKGVGC